MVACAHRRIYRTSALPTPFPHPHRRRLQLLSVISLLSSDTPNTDSPANVDAAKEVRENPQGPSAPRIAVYFRLLLTWLVLFLLARAPAPTLIGFRGIAYKKKVRRLVRKSAEDVFD